MSMYGVGTVTGAANQAKVTGVTTKWSRTALGVQQGSILVVYRNGSADLYAIKSVDSDTQLTLTRNITTAFSGGVLWHYHIRDSQHLRICKPTRQRLFSVAECC